MHPPPAFINWSDGSLDAPDVRTSEKKLGQLAHVFHDREAFARLDPDTVVYRVWWWQPVNAGTEGGLFWGVTEIQPGRVGREYFMTQGHRHTIRNRAEFYGTVQGTGRLLLRNDAGRVWCEEMVPGSLHYIGGDVAHRTINTGNVPLRVLACWPSDAGHDYHIGEGQGFCVRIEDENGVPVMKTEGDVSA